MRKLKYMFHFPRAERMKGDWFVCDRGVFCEKGYGRSGLVVHLISNFGEGATMSEPFDVVTPPVTPPFQELTKDSRSSL